MAQCRPRGDHDHLLSSLREKQASPSEHDPALLRVHNGRVPSGCGPSAESAKRRSARRKERSGSTRKFGKRQKDFHEGRLLRMPRPRGSRRRTRSRTTHWPSATFLRGLHEIRPPAHRPDAAVHEQSDFRSGTHRHLCLLAVQAESHTLQEHPTAQSIEVTRLY